MSSIAFRGPSLPLRLLRVVRASSAAARSRAVIGAAAFLLFGLMGCASGGGGSGGAEGEGTIQDIDAPASIRSDQEMTVTVRGIAGPNLCWGLVRIDRRRTDGRLALTAVVSSSERDGVMCAQALAEFEEHLTVSPPFEGGTFELAARQDGQERVLATVDVR